MAFDILKQQSNGDSSSSAIFLQVVLSIRLDNKETPPSATENRTLNIKENLSLEEKSLNIFTMENPYELASSVLRIRERLCCSIFFFLFFSYQKNILSSFAISRGNNVIVIHGYLSIVWRLDGLHLALHSFFHTVFTVKCWPCCC